MIRVVCMLIRCKFTRWQISINIVVSCWNVVRVSFEYYLMRLVIKVLHSLRKMSGCQVQRGSFNRCPIRISGRFIVSRFCILNLLKDLLSHHLINENLFFLSIFCCLSNFPYLHFSLIIVDNLNDIIIPHLSRIISWERIYSVVSS